MCNKNNNQNHDYSGGDIVALLHRNVARAVAEIELGQVIAIQGEHVLLEVVRYCKFRQLRNSTPVRRKVTYKVQTTLAHIRPVCKEHELVLPTDLEAA